jgi:thiol-disulfide isomerase/thioredoxin
MNSRFPVISLFCGMYLFSLGCTPPPDSTPSLAKSSGTTEASLSVTENDTEETAKDATKTPFAVDLSVVDLAGLNERVKGLTGKVIVVDLWSTSCIPCMREFPNLVALGTKYPERVACVSFNLDYIGIKSKPPESYLPKVQEFLDKTITEAQKSAVTNLLSATPDGDVLTEFSAESIPAILIFGSDGQLAHTLTDANSGDDGLTYEGDVLPKVEAMLGKN